ncbi:hypothetical protein ANO14919_067430 [Xylariales sp. No.14919]|nr:hypothetical protein ANO14919_067430 [Xylariales sp. No.14919]
MTIADTSVTNDADGGSTIHFCHLCNKPILSETAFKRHLAYCRRTVGKPKKRKRSCRQCHRAKAKCSFDLPCSRCIAKGVSCEYEKVIGPALLGETSNDGQDVSMSEPSEGSPSDGVSSPDYEQTHAGLPSFERVATMIEIQNITPSPPRTITELRTDPKRHGNAMFLLENIRALPHMMSRRETFPLFIHGRQPEISSAYAHCMRVCRLYVARNTSPDGRARFYSAINEEAARFEHELPAATKGELLGSLAVQGIYTMLVALENQPPHADFVPELMARERDIDLMTSIARQTFEQDAYAPFDIDTIGNPNETWEEFIYAESRRRTAVFWFIASRVVHLRYGNQCPPVLGYRGLSLPAPKALWGARTREEWEAVRTEIREQRQEPLYNPTLRTVGDLIDSRERASNPDCERHISNWLASCDTLGTMIEVASTMV